MEAGFAWFAVFVAVGFGLALAWMQRQPRANTAAPTMDRPPEYFLNEDNDRIYAVTSAGIFSRGPDESRWEFHVAGSLRWDSLHQTLYVDRRWIEPLSAEAIARQPPLPEVDVAPVRSWADNFDPNLRVPATELPALAAALREGEVREVYVVLHEDRWETLHGDGRYHYLDSVHFDAKAAAERVAALGGEYSRGHLRTMSVCRRDREVFMPGYAVETFDHVRVRQILSALEQLVG